MCWFLSYTTWISHRYTYVPFPLGTSLHLAFSFYFHMIILEAPRIQAVLLRILLRPLLLLPPYNSVSTPCILWLFITFAPLWFLLPGIHRLPTQCTFKPSFNPPQSLLLLARCLWRASQASYRTTALGLVSIPIHKLLQRGRRDHVAPEENLWRNLLEEWEWQTQLSWSIFLHFLLSENKIFGDYIIFCPVNIPDVPNYSNNDQQLTRLWSSLF